MTDLDRLTAAPRRALGAAGRRTREALDPRRWGDLLSPAPRAAGFFVRAWQDGSGAPGGRPARPGLATLAGALVDEGAGGIFRFVTMPAAPDVLERREAEALVALDRLERAGLLDEPERYHGAPPPPADVARAPARAGLVAYDHISFPSEYRPPLDEPGCARWLAHEPNRTAHAWVLEHPEPRPWLVCVHGAAMGRPVADLAAFHAAFLHHRLGLNLAMPVLPLHGPRASGGWRTIGYPTEDPLDSIHATAQAVWDVRRVVRWARTRGDTPVGLFGLSLGGLVVALTAGLEDGLGCVIAGVPVVELASTVGGHLPARVRRDERYERLAELSVCLHHVVSPLAVTPRLPRERRFVFGGLADRLVHPYRQVHELWEHWDRPAMEWYPGGHAGFFRAERVGAFVRAALVASELVERAGEPRAAKGAP